MTQVIMGIQIAKRTDEADKVQKLLTEYGCFIKTRIGLHRASDDREYCTDNGLIILQFTINSDKEIDEMEGKLRLIDGVIIRKMVF